jgi:hypothetical protein
MAKGKIAGDLIQIALHCQTDGGDTLCPQTHAYNLDSGLRSTTLKQKWMMLSFTTLPENAQGDEVCLR